MLSILAVALGITLVCFFKAVPARFLSGFAAALPVFLACLTLLGVYRVRRDSWMRRPDRWSGWLVRETARALFMPIAVAVVGASALSTIAFFTALQKGPQAGLLLLELGIVTAAGWAVVTVGGVWARGRASTTGGVARRTTDQ